MTTAADGYAHPEYLTDPAWVAAHLDDPGVVVLDCANTADAWQRGHVPGAAHVPDNWAKNPDDRQHVMTPEQFKAYAESLGVGDDTTVVTYDHAQGLTAARMWWVFSYYGHRNVKVLNGGWRAWVNAGQPVDFGRPRPPAVVSFTPQRRRVLHRHRRRAEVRLHPGQRRGVGRAQRRRVGRHRGELPQ